MATYQAVMDNTWDDPVFQAWSPNAKLMFLNLLTSHRQNPLGLYAVTVKTMIFELGINEAQVKGAMEELQRPTGGYARIRYDEGRCVIWIVNALRHQPGISPRNRNILVHIKAVWNQHKDSPLVNEIRAYYEPRGYGWLFEYLTNSPKPLASPLKAPPKSPNRLGKVRLGKVRLKKRGIAKGERLPEQPHQALINRFLELKGTPRSHLTPEQVNGVYKRHSRSALALIQEAGGLTHALAALECAATYFTRKALSWTLDTVARHLPDLGQYSQELAAANYGLSRRQLEQWRQLASWLNSKTHTANRRQGAGAPDESVSQGGVGSGVRVADVV